jgi:hypothetical protein
MKSLFKVTLLATTMAVVLNAPLAMAAETTDHESQDSHIGCEFELHFGN